MDATSTRTQIWDVINSKHYIPSTGNGASIMPRACAIQNVSDTHHDGLNPDAARNTLPSKPINFTESKDISEDEFLATYLYNLNKGTPKTTTINPYLLDNYHCFFRIPLIHGETTNVGSTGEPQYPDRNSVLETIFDELGLANQNIYVSKDFGFPAMQYDFTYFKNRQIYIGYRPAQENDAAGKPTLTSSKAFEFGFQSPNIKVDFIWTTPEIDPGFTHLPRWSGGTPDESPTLNYSLLDYDTIIRWDPDQHGPSANALKSQTFFVKPEGDNYARSIIYQSNSEWTSKSGKELKAYQQFNNGAQEILKKNPLALGDPITSANKAITATDFDEFHSLAKRSGDALTAYIKPFNDPDNPLNNQQFMRLNPKSANVSGPTEKFDLTDFAFMYQTHDRLAAAGALTRKVEMVILESPRDNEGKSYFSLFIRKDMLDVKKIYNTIKNNYYGKGTELENQSPYSELTEYLKKYLKKYLETKNVNMESDEKSDGIVVSEDDIKDIDEIIKSVDPTWSDSKYHDRVDIDRLRNNIVNIGTKLETDIAILNPINNPINNDADIVSYIRLQMLKKTINDIDNDFRTLESSEHIYITTFLGKIAYESINKYKPNPDNTDTGMKQFITNVVYPFNEYRSCMKTHNALNALADKIDKLIKNSSGGDKKIDNEFVDELLANLGTLVQLNKTTIDSLNNIKPNTQIDKTSIKRITGRFNPLKLFATSKDRLNILLSTDLQDLFGFPELLLKLWDKLPEDALPTIYNYYHNAYERANVISTANPNNHDLEIITQCLGFVFRDKRYNASIFKTDLMEFGEHKELLLTEKKTKDDFMFELPAILKPLSKRKMIAQEEKKKTILSKIVNFTNRMLGRIVPTRGGKKTRVRRCKIVGKRTKKYRGGKKREREDDNNGDDNNGDDNNGDGNDGDGNDGPTKRTTRINVNIQSTPRDIELLFRILGLFVFFLTFLHNKIKNEKTKTFCSIRFNKINNIVTKLYITHFDRFISLFPNINLKNMFHYGNTIATDNNIYKYNPNDVFNNYEQLINKSSQDNGDLFNKVDTFENKIAYLFGQYIPFFIYNNNIIVNNDFDEDYQFEQFKMLYENTITSVVMYIIGTYVGDIVDDQEINYFDKYGKNVSKIIYLKPHEDTQHILGFLPAILTDNIDIIIHPYLDAIIEKMPIVTPLPKINTISLKKDIFVKQHIRTFYPATIEGVMDNIMKDIIFKTYKDKTYDDNTDIDIFINCMNNIKQQLPVGMNTGFTNPQNIFGTTNPPFSPFVFGQGGYKSSRKNKKYRKPRKYRYR
jgi:hypothetical protein